MSDAAKVYGFDRFLLNPAERVLLRDGRRVALTPKSFDLLVVLVEHSGHLVEKDALLKAVWPNQFVEESNLPFTISTLRKALEGGNSDCHRLIDTIPKRGYRFTAPVRIVSHQATASTGEALSSRLPSRNRLSWKARRVVAATVAVAAVLVALWFTRPGQEQAPEQTAVRSVAVLPFRQLDRTVGEDYMGVALADSLTSKLSSLRRIAVRATSSVLQHATNGDTATIGRALDVDAVIEGTFQRTGDRIRVTAQLVGVTGVHKGASLWAQSFDAEFSEVFAVQDRISERVADALRIQLDDDERKLLAKRHTTDAEAFDLYARGRYFWNKRNASVQTAIALFERAIARDPNYALAYSGLADCYAFTFELLPQDRMPRARRAALKALALDDGLAEAHTSLAQIIFKYDWDWGAAERSFQRAIQLNSNYAPAHQWYARYLSAMGQPESALHEARRALQIDPASVVFNHTLAETLYFARRYRESIDQFQRCHRTFKCGH